MRHWRKFKWQAIAILKSWTRELDCRRNPQTQNCDSKQIVIPHVIGGVVVEKYSVGMQHQVDFKASYLNVGDGDRS